MKSSIVDLKKNAAKGKGHLYFSGETLVERKDGNARKATPPVGGKTGAIRPTQTLSGKTTHYERQISNYEAWVGRRPIG